MPTVQAFTEDGRELNCFLHSSVAGLLNRDNHRDSGYRHTDDVVIILPPLHPKRRLSQLHFNSQTLNANTDATRLGEVCTTAWQVLRRESPSIGEYAATSEIRNAFIPRENVVVVDNHVVVLEQQAASETTRLGLFPVDGAHFGLRRLPREPIPVASGVYLGTNLDFLFYEALVYGLPKLALAMRVALDPNATIILNDYMHPAVEDLFRQVLAKNGRANEILKASRSTELQVDRLIGIEFNQACLETATKHEAGLRAAAEQVLSALGYSSLRNRDDGNVKIWITRRAQARDLFDRTPANIAEIEDAVRRHGFAVVDPGALTIGEQIETFATADVVASLHGGALANLLWCRPGTRVLEIFTSWIDPCFEQLSEEMDLEYESIRCEYTRAKVDPLDRARRLLRTSGQRHDRFSTLDLVVFENALCRLRDSPNHPPP